MSPIWLDEHGQGRPTRPCPKCGKDEPARRLRFDHLRMIGWKPLVAVQIVNWCGTPELNRAMRRWVESS